MNFSKYTTQELEFITSNVGLLKKELKKRYIKESGNFIFTPGDVIYSKHGNDNSLLKIKKIDRRTDTVVADEIEISDYGLFNTYVDEWFDFDTTEWNEYVKIKDSEIFENILNIIDKYNDERKQLNDDVYLKIKNEISHYDNLKNN
jgi:hypothetical protein